MKNPSMIHRAENMWIMFAPYRHAIKEDCPAKVKLALMVNKWMNPWHAMQDLEKVIPAKRLAKLKENLKGISMTIASGIRRLTVPLRFSTRTT